jgi:hypothetical protein
MINFNHINYYKKKIKNSPLIKINYKTFTFSWRDLKYKKIYKYSFYTNIII